MATIGNIFDLKLLAKTSVDAYDFFELANSVTGLSKKISVSSLFPSLVTSGTSSEALFVSVTNKNQLNFKGIKSGDTGLLTVATTSNNIVLTALEAGIDLSLCNNATSGFVSGMDFTGTITGENPVVNGGTGLATIAKGALLYADSTDSIAATAAMSTNGHLLIGNATNGYPSVATLTAGTGMTITNGAGTITLAATITNAEANIDLRNTAGSTTYHIDTHAGTGYLSGDGSAEGVTVDNDAKVYLGADAQKTFDDALNINGGIRFTNAGNVSIKPNATDGATGKKVTIEGGSAASDSGADLELKAGSSTSGNNAGGNVTVYAGSEAGSGNAGEIKMYTYTAGASATQALTVDRAQDVTVNAGSLIITSATEGIVHTGMTVATQATDHTTGLTINATSGIITLAAVALNAATNAEFTFTNSTIQADSVIMLTMQDANTTNNAQLTCALVSVTGGSCVISVHNPAATGATSATASKIHFLVINNSI